MFIHFTLHDASAVKTHDHFLDDEVEIYQTWLMTRLEPLAGDPEGVIATDGQKVQLARTGFSVRGAPDDGMTFHAPAPARLVLDPQITFDLPKDAIEKGSRYLFRLQFFWWESDHGTAKVRSTFSDSTLGVFIDALQKAKQDEAAARSAAAKWVEDHWQDIVMSGVIAAGVGANPWVQIGLQVLPGLEALLKLAFTHGDSFIDRHEFVISTRGTGDSLEWFVIPPSGEMSPRITGTGFASFDDLPVEEANGNTRMRGTYVFRIID